MSTANPPDTADLAWSAATHALINAAETEPGYWEDLQPLPVVPLSHRGKESLFPVLVDLQESEGQRARVREREQHWEWESKTPYLMALFETSASADALAEHLTRRMGVQRPDGRMDALRYYDPYVFRNLLWLLTPEQMDRVLGPIKTWHWREPEGQWQSRHRQAEDDPGLIPLRLTPEQWPTLLRMAELQSVARQLAWIGFINAWSPKTMQRADALLAQARAQGLGSAEDRGLYAQQALRFGRDIHQHPELKSRLAQATRGAMSYGMACADLDDMRMFELTEELKGK